MCLVEEVCQSTVERPRLSFSFDVGASEMSHLSMVAMVVCIVIGVLMFQLRGEILASGEAVYSLHR